MTTIALNYRNRLTPSHLPLPHLMISRPFVVSWLLIGVSNAMQKEDAIEADQKKEERKSFVNFQPPFH